MISIPGAAPVVILSLVLSGSEGSVCAGRSVEFMINHHVSLCAIGMTRFPYQRYCCKQAEKG